VVKSYARIYKLYPASTFSVGLTRITSTSIIHLQIRKIDLCFGQLVTVFAQLFLRIVFLLDTDRGYLRLDFLIEN